MGYKRFGFNGKEFDWEAKGWMNQIDYGARVYDPRIGRFLSVDPISRDYPGLTPYQFASNTPIWASDLDGLEADFSGAKMQKEKREEYGHWFLNYVGNKDAIYHNMAASGYNQVIDAAEDVTNLVASEKGREQVALKYGASFLAFAEFSDKFKKGEISFEQMWQATKEFFKNPENIEDLGGTLLVSIIPASAITKLKLPTAIQTRLKPLANLVEGLKSTLQGKSIVEKGYVRIGRWMSETEYKAMVNTGKVQPATGGQTFGATSGSGSFKSQAAKGSVYVEYDVPINSVLQGGKTDWVKTLSEEANKAMKTKLKNQGGELNPPAKNISKILETKE